MKRKNKCEFSREVREIIKRRDAGCIFCRMLEPSGFEPTQIAHCIPRSRGGLGVAKNGVFICVPHHQELDNGMNTKEMQERMREYLSSLYSEWNEEDLIYDKWRGL